MHLTHDLLKHKKIIISPSKGQGLLIKAETDKRVSTSTPQIYQWNNTSNLLRKPSQAYIGIAQLVTGDYQHLVFHNKILILSNKTFKEHTHKTCWRTKIMIILYADHLWQAMYLRHKYVFNFPIYLSFTKCS